MRIVILYKNIIYYIININTYNIYYYINIIYYTLYRV